MSWCFLHVLCPQNYSVPLNAWLHSFDIDYVDLSSESSIGHKKTSQIIRGYVNWAMACMQSTINTGNLLSPEKISWYNVRIERLHKVGGLSSWIIDWTQEGPEVSWAAEGEENPAEFDVGLESSCGHCGRPQWLQIRMTYMTCPFLKQFQYSTGSPNHNHLNPDAPHAVEFRCI